jgi:Ca2+-binding RTX toxin-like protein
LLSATIAAGTLSAVESLSVNGRFASDPASRPSYALVIENGNIAPGERLIVNGASLEAGQQLNVDASRVSDGRVWLFGGASGEVLTAGSNDDLIYAAAGSDALRGGAGADLFQYRSPGDSTAGSQDRIYDFEHGLDRIDLSQIDADIEAPGDQAFTVLIGGELSAAAGEVRAGYDADAGLWRVIGDVDGDGGADFLIEVIVPAGQALDPGDFVV